MKESKDRFQKMWQQQYEFMLLLKERRSFPNFPVDLSTKEGQKFLKSVTYECMGELFEANQELKNSKSHRATDVKELNRDAYVEELVDVLHYLLEIVIASGISIDEFYDAYMDKGKINTLRIKGDY